MEGSTCWNLTKGGMFVQSEKFVEDHQGRIGDIAIYGQESNYTTWRLCKMNLAVRGIDSDIRWNSEGSDLFTRTSCLICGRILFWRIHRLIFPIGGAIGFGKMPAGGLELPPQVMRTMPGCNIFGIISRLRERRGWCWRMGRCLLSRAAKVRSARQ